MDPQEEFNYKWGYLPPFDEESEKVVTLIIDNPDLAKTMTRTQPGTQAFWKGLDQRNVHSKESKQSDKHGEEIKSMDLNSSWEESPHEQKAHDFLWTLDQAKITATSSEALFQRTLMVSLIARHFLIYKKDKSEDQVLDFSVEEPWTCLPMPSAAVDGISTPKSADDKFLTAPKPDLAVCFNREAVISDSIWESLPWPTKALACFENMTSCDSRIFHFLVMEAKRASTIVDDTKALHQCLNCASQALFNLYEFFNDAGPEHRKVFFEKVRIFSVVARRQGLLVRTHRATEIPESDGALKLVMPLKREYRLRFEYREFARIPEGKDFHREKVLEIFKKIFTYGVNDLRTYLRAAASALHSKLAKEMSEDLQLFRAKRHDTNLYRYGQPCPEPSKSSRPPTTALSADGGDASLTRGMHKSHLNENDVLSMGDQSVRSGQTTPKPTKQSRPQPGAMTRSQKRKSGGAATEARDGEGVRKSSTFKRQRREASLDASTSPTSSSTIATA